MPLIVTGVFWTFLNVAVLGLLAWPTAKLPNDSSAGDNLVCAKAGAMLSKKDASRMPQQKDVRTNFLLKEYGYHTRSPMLALVLVMSFQFRILRGPVCYESATSNTTWPDVKSYYTVG